jgi:hypothetical protein
MVYQFNGRWRLALHSFILARLCIFVSGQLVNGQFFTPGLAILNAPAPNSQHNTGGNLPISVDVSGNGRLPPAASLPGSTLRTAFLWLNIFLVSSQTGLNLTVSNGPRLLAGEQGSTVKHLNWLIPECVAPGQYNLTYYEGSRINGQTYFSITPTSIFIRGSDTAASAPCSGTFAVETRPQSSFPPPTSPFIDPNFNLLTTAPTLTTSRAIPPTQTFTSVPTPTPSETKNEDKGPDKEKPGDKDMDIMPVMLSEQAQLFFAINSSNRLKIGRQLVILAVACFSFTL